MPAPDRSLLVKAGAALALGLAVGCAEGATPSADHRSALAYSAGERRTAEAFESRVKDYRALCQRLEKEVPDLPKRASPEQIDEHQRSMGASIQAARAGAKRGELFSADMEALVRKILRTVLSGPDARLLKASIMDENPGLPHLGVNDRLPDGTPVSTMPPQVLAALPKLEEELEYRFIGERLALIDPHARLVIDFTADVLP